MPPEERNVLADKKLLYTAPPTACVMSTVTARKAPPRTPSCMLLFATLYGLLLTAVARSELASVAELISPSNTGGADTRRPTSAGIGDPFAIELEVEDDADSNNSNNKPVEGPAEGLYVPLTRRASPGGAAYGVDVSEAGIARRRGLEGIGVGIARDGAGERSPPVGCGIPTRIAGLGFWSR